MDNGLADDVRTFTADHELTTSCILSRNASLHVSQATSSPMGSKDVFNVWGEIPARAPPP